MAPVHGRLLADLLYWGGGLVLGHQTFLRRVLHRVDDRNYSA